MTSADPRTSLASYYSRVALHYAERWGPVLRPLGEELVGEMPLDGARLVLDNGTGTGSLLPILRERAPDALVLGADLSMGMLRTARSSAPDVPLVAMDAQRLALRADCADAAISVFVLFHVPDPTEALREVKRVLRPGGIVGTATWAEYRPPGADIWTEELDASEAEADPMPKEVQQHELVDTEAKVAALLRLVGLELERTRTLRVEHRWTVDDVVRTRELCGGFGRRLATLAPEARESCLRRVRDRLELLPAAQLVEAMGVVLAVARKPG